MDQRGVWETEREREREGLFEVGIEFSKGQGQTTSTHIIIYIVGFCF